MNKNITYAGIIIALIAAIFAISNSRQTSHPSTPTLPFASTTAATPQRIPVSTAIAVNTGGRETASPKSAVFPADNVTLKAADTTYGGYISNPEKVLQFMQTLSSTTDFAFTGKDYPSLGYFIESIGGKKNGDGFYWILYINGKSSNAGVSDAVISPGDTIEWRYEKGY